MAHKVHIEVMRGCRGGISVPELRRIARGVLVAENVAYEVEVTVVLADMATSHDLNRLHRGPNEPTDVLSFAATGEFEFVEAPDAVLTLGDIVICVPIAEAQAEAQGAPAAGAIAHLTVHGMLHLLAYDHEEDADAAEMQSREDELLSSLGYAGQYAHGH